MCFCLSGHSRCVLQTSHHLPTPHLLRCTVWKEQRSRVRGCALGQGDYCHPATRQPSNHCSANVLLTVCHLICMYSVLLPPESRTDLTVCLPVCLCFSPEEQSIPFPNVESFGTEWVIVLCNNCRYDIRTTLNEIKWTLCRMNLVSRKASILYHIVRLTA